MALANAALAWLLLGICWVSSTAALSSDGTTYRAAAAQFYPLKLQPSSTPEIIVSANLAAFEKFASQAHQEKVDVLVFPEGGLGMFFAEYWNTRQAMRPFCEQLPTKPGINPCTDPAFAGPEFVQVRTLSCLARNYSLTLVGNTCDVQPCSASSDPNCPADGRYQYNTDIAFNVDGSVLAKYHKSHLFGGDKVFDQASPVPTTFKSSFGVTFGMFVCFDIEFWQPAVELAKSGVKNFVFSSWWVNSAPWQNAMAIQQAFSRHLSVNLVASNTGQDPQNGGGGIYSSGQPLAHDFSDSFAQHRLLLTADLPVNPSPSLDTSHVSPLSPSRPVRRSHSASATQQCALPFGGTAPCVLVNTTQQRNGSLSLQAGSIQCDATFAFAAQSPAQRFALVGWVGEVAFPDTPDPMHVQSCFFLVCKQDSQAAGGSPAHCMPTWTSSVRLDQLALSASNLASNVTVWPLLGVDNGQIANASQVSTSGLQASSNSPAKLWLTKPTTSGLVSAALYGVQSSHTTLFRGHVNPHLLRFLSSPGVSPIKPTAAHRTPFFGTLST